MPSRHLGLFTGPDPGVHVAVIQVFKAERCGHRVLLDTDIFSEVPKQRDPLVAARAVLPKVEGRFTISVVTAMEIAAGLHRVKSFATRDFYSRAKGERNKRSRKT